MGLIPSTPNRYRLLLLLLVGALALLFTLAGHPKTTGAQISPLSPLTVATPLPESQPQVIATDTPSPLPAPLPDNSQLSTADQKPSTDRELNQSQPPSIPLGEPTQAQPSLILVGLLLLGLGLLVLVVLVARRRE